MQRSLAENELENQFAAKKSEHQKHKRGQGPANRPDSAPTKLNPAKQQGAQD